MGTYTIYTYKVTIFISLVTNSCTLTSDGCLKLGLVPNDFNLCPFLDQTPLNLSRNNSATPRDGIGILNRHEERFVHVPDRSGNPIVYSF